MSSAKVQQKNVGSVFDLPAKSYEIVKNNWQMFAVVNVLSLISAFFALGGPDNNKTNPYSNGAFDTGGFASGWELAAVLGLSFIFAIAFLALSIFLYAMSTVLKVEASKGKKPDFNTLVEGGKKYWLRILGLSVLSGLIVLVGLILLIIPGIFAIGRVAMAPFFMIDKDLGVIDSLKASNEMGEKHWQAVWAAILLFIGISIIAGIVSGIPYIGALISAIGVIAFSLILPLRYLQLK
jgi:hypothetical protein